VSNRPINFSDPSGHKETDDLMGGGTPCIVGDLACQLGKQGDTKDDDGCLLHQAFCLGWDWLTEQGDGSSVDSPRVYDESDELVQDLMNSQGAKDAWQEFLDNGEVDNWHAVEVNFESYSKGFIFKATWTETYLGGHIIFITNNGDGTATFMVKNTTGLASLTHNPESNYLNPSVQTILGNIAHGNNAFDYLPDRLPTGFDDFMFNYSPSSIFTDADRSAPGFGGNLYQEFTWTVPIP